MPSGWSFENEDRGEGEEGKKHFVFFVVRPKLERLEIYKEDTGFW